METYDVLILTSDWVDSKDSHEIIIYGRCEELGPVELIFDEVKPVFFVDRDEQLPALDFEYERKELKLKSMDGKDIDGLYFNTYKDQRTAADRFQATGVRHYEADVRPDDRFLMERFINGQAKIAGEYTQNGKLASFKNPKIRNARVEVDLITASIDLECGVTVDELYSIAIHLTGKNMDKRKVFMLANRRETISEELEFYPSESGVLKAFMEWFNNEDPDLIIGWHVIGFDLMYLDRKCREFGFELDISRNGDKIILTDRPGAGYFATIAGRVVIDGPPAMRNNGYSFPNYKLETVAQSILQQGKLIASDHNKVAEIERQFREDKEALAKYNMEDCVLVTEIYEKIDLINLFLKRSFYSGMLISSLGITNASFDHYYLPKLHRKGFTGPNAQTHDSDTGNSWDLEPKPGTYEHVVMLDMGNLYPSLIRSFNIEPLSHAQATIDPVTIPGNYQFSSSMHLLPFLLERLMMRQKDARAKGDHTTEKAVTIQLANICKVIHNKNSRFFKPALSAALQEVGQWVARESGTYLEAKGYQVIRTDEDAIFLALQSHEVMQPQASGDQIAKNLEAYWSERLNREFTLTSCLDISFGKYYSHFVQPQNTQKYDKKCFVGFTKDKEFVGMDQLLNDWTDLARNFMEELYTVHFTGQDLDSWVLNYADRLKKGEFNDQMAIVKKIRKALDEYAKNAPPHIRAARMLDNPGRQIAYVWTKRGPIPQEHNPTDIDIDFYLKKQIEPVAETLLLPMGKTFKSLTEPEQISLF